MNWRYEINMIMCFVFALIMCATLFCCGIWVGHDKAQQTYQVKHDPREEAAYFNRVNTLIFAELKRNFGGTVDAVPLISVCPDHDCCIMQSKNNKIIHHQFSYTYER